LKTEEESIIVNNRFGDTILEINLAYVREGIFADAWYGYVSADEYKILMNGIVLDVFIGTGCNKKICNTQKLKIGMDNDTSKWFKDIFFLKLIKAGLKYNAIIIPSDQYARDSMQYFEANLKNNHGILFPSFEIALLWMRSLRE
jgi:hypothetical protein